MKRVAAFALMFAMCTAMFAQVQLTKNQLADTKPEKSKSAKTESKKEGNSKTAQPLNVEYTDSILKNTTDKMFLTEIVDHLPASAKVPSPEKVLGYPIGTPNKLTYTKDQYRYYHGPVFAVRQRESAKLSQYAH